MRTFVAVFPPQSVVDAVAGVVETVREPGDGVSWVKPGNVHYTLRFLDDLEPSRVEAAKRAASEAVRGIAPFAVRLGGPGMFPNERAPRVLWLGAAQGADELRLVARSLDEALRREGFGRPDRPFQPHLTLGRTRDPRTAAPIAARFAQAAFPDVVFDVTAVVVVHSKLNPRGSIYTPLGHFALEASGMRPGTGAAPPKEGRSKA